MEEQKKIEKWLQEEKSKGLIDIKLYPINTDTTEKEHIYAELNAMNAAISDKRYLKVSCL
jgi:hypothetical protein